MSYYGSKFPEGIDPSEYREILGVEQITCPLFRKTVQGTLKSDVSVVNACSGCGQERAVILELSAVPGETERIFVRRDAKCTSQS